MSVSEAKHTTISRGSKAPRLVIDEQHRVWITQGDRQAIVFQATHRYEPEVQAGVWASNVARQGLEPVVVMERPECGNFGCFMGESALFCGSLKDCMEYAEGFNGVFSQVEAVAA